MTSNGDEYDLDFPNSPTQVTSSDSRTDASFSELAATPNECEDQPRLRRLRARARRQRRNPDKPLSCPAKVEIPYRQPPEQNRQTSGESTEPNISTQQDTTGGKKTTGSPGPTPEPWLIPVSEPKWDGYNPTCFSKTYGLLPLAVCDSSPYQLPSSYDLHGEPNLAFSQPPKWEGPRHAGDIGPQPVQLGIDLNNPKSWQLNYAWLGTYFPRFQFSFPNLSFFRFFSFSFFFLFGFLHPKNALPFLIFFFFTTSPSPQPHPPVSHPLQEKRKKKKKILIIFLSINLLII